MTRTAVAAVLCLIISVPTLLPAQQSRATFSSGTEAILVPVWVTDKNKPVAGLAASDFQLLDNGVVQHVTLSVGDPPPLDVTLVLDTSGSLAGKALDQLKLDVQQIAELLQLTDRLRLLTFGRDVADVFGLQPGGARVPVERISSGGTTSFYNALAAALLMSVSDRRQMVFAFSDGLDDGSFLDSGQIAALAQRSNASLYVALVSSNDNRTEQSLLGHGDPMANEHNIVTVGGVPLAERGTGPYRGGPNVSALRAAAALAGGAIYQNPPSAQLQVIFQHVLDDFRSSYVLSYTPADVPRPGWHELSVRTRNSAFTVRARKGYDGG